MLESLWYYVVTSLHYITEIVEGPCVHTSNTGQVVCSSPVAKGLSKSQTVLPTKALGCQGNTVHASVSHIKHLQMLTMHLDCHPVWRM